VKFRNGIESTGKRESYNENIVAKKGAKI